MIINWKVANFKSIREETKLELSPLTIFAGSNSSGKSTLIQSILLIAQSLAPKIDTSHFVLNGVLTNLGQFNDLLSNKGKTDQITIECTYRPLVAPYTEKRRHPLFPYSSPFIIPWADQLREISCEVTFDANSSSSEGELFQLQPQLYAMQLSCKIRDEDNTDQSFKISIRRSLEAEKYVTDTAGAKENNDQQPERRIYQVELDELSMSEMKEHLNTAEPVDCHFKHFLPDELVVEFDVSEASARAIALMMRRATRVPRMVPRSVSGNELLPKEVIDFLRDLLKDLVDFNDVGWVESRDELPLRPNRDDVSIRELRAWMSRLPGQTRFAIEKQMREDQNLFDRIHKKMKRSTIDTQKRTESHRLPSALGGAARQLENFFISSLKYLGPLRDSPKQLYPIVHAADPNNVGLRGEHSASILELHKDKDIQFIPSKNFLSPVIDRTIKTQTLETAVNDWLGYLEIADSVNAQYQSKWGREIKVQISNSTTMHDLTHVGVGVSQVLPILVMCLLADPDSTLVLEQPELHLHPRVQTLLGDFFLSVALCHKQCIVETHSEHLIDRLRYRIAATTTQQELNSKTKIYFVEKKSKGSMFQEVSINEYGAISNWPPGFFDQSHQEAQQILMAAAKKRDSKRSESTGKIGKSNC